MIMADVKEIQITVVTKSDADSPPPSAISKEVENQEVEWIKFGQTSQRDLRTKYVETAKTLIGLFATIFAVFTVLLSFFGLPGLVNINPVAAILTIGCFTVSIILLIFVISPPGFLDPRKEVNYSNPDAIWTIISDRNGRDHKILSAGIILFAVGIALIAGSIFYSVSATGDPVRIITSSDTVPYLENATIRFEDNSTLSEEMYLIRQDSEFYTFQLSNKNLVKVQRDWVSAFVTIKR